MLKFVVTNKLLNTVISVHTDYKLYRFTTDSRSRTTGIVAFSIIIVVEMQHFMVNFCKIQ